MRKCCLILALACLSASFALAGTPAPAAGQAPTAKPAAPPAVLTTPEGCVDLGYSEETLKAAGLQVVPKPSTSDFTPCPDIYGCGGYHVHCEATNCSDQDLGYSACQLPGGAVVSCNGGKTIHVTDCGCQELFRDRCCSESPACLCIGCNSGSQTVSCE